MFVIEILNELVGELLVLIVSLIQLFIICVGFVILSVYHVFRL